MKTIIKYIKQLALEKKLPPAYILINKNKKNRYNFIKLIARFILCKNSLKLCSLSKLCNSCKNFHNNIHPDYYEINITDEIIKITI